MQNTSSLYQQIIVDDNHYFETKVVINGVTYNEDEIFSLSTDVAMFENNPEIGKAVAGEIDLTMLRPNVDIPRMATIVPYVRVCADIATASPVSIVSDIVDFGTVGSMVSDIMALDNSAWMLNDIVYFRDTVTHYESEWIQKGVYYVDTREYTHNEDHLNQIIFHGFDAMLFAEQGYPETDSGWPEEGVVDTTVVSTIAQTMGVTVDSRTWDVMTDANMIPLPGTRTLREMLGFIASMYVGSWVITDTGKLRLISILDLPPDTNYLTDMLGYAITFGGDRILV